MQTITAIILTKNEEKMLPGCLAPLGWVNEILIVDSGSDDKTIEIAKGKGARIIQLPFSSFADARHRGATAAKTDWLFYVDADERVGHRLQQEIVKHVLNDGGGTPSAYRMPRKNILLGKWLRHGGWFPDYQTRLIRRTALKGWRGDIHESPEVEGSVGELQGQLIHLAHRSIRDGLLKSAEWSGIEARVRFRSGHPRVKKLGVFRVVIGEFFRRYVMLHGWRDGMEGFLEAIIQGLNMFLIYARLWELQRKETLEQTYKEVEKMTNKE